MTLKSVIRDFEDVTNNILFNCGIIIQCTLYSVKWQLLVHVVVSQSVVALMLMTYAGGWSTRGKPLVLPITVLERTYRSTLLPYTAFSEHWNGGQEEVQSRQLTAQVQ